VDTRRDALFDVGSGKGEWSKDTVTKPLKWVGLGDVGGGIIDTTI
jgi:hypothetical protein